MSTSKTIILPVTEQMDGDGNVTLFDERHHALAVVERKAANLYEVRLTPMFKDGEVTLAYSLLQALDMARERVENAGLEARKLRTEHIEDREHWEKHYYDDTTGELLATVRREGVIDDRLTFSVRYTDPPHFLETYDPLQKIHYQIVHQLEKNLGVRYVNRHFR